MFAEALPFVREYISELTDELRQTSGHSLSTLQQNWLSFCLTGMLLTQTLCWAAFERMGFGAYTVGALSWMFRNSNIPWSAILKHSVSCIMRILQIKSGVLVVDDTDHRRAKKTNRIYGAHKIFDKKTGGYFNGQCLVFLLLVTDKVTLPVGFGFYRPDSNYRNWEIADNLLKKNKVKASERPKAPDRDPAFPGKKKIAVALIDKFHCDHPDVTIKAVVADSAFGTVDFMKSVSEKSGCSQVISQLKEDQLVMYKNRLMTVKNYFAKHEGVLQPVMVRGDRTREMRVGSARLLVKAQGVKRFVIAVKNESESDYRYLVATDLTWRTLDILRCYTLRWLVEVFFEDWKLHEGWTGMAKQPDEEGSVRGLTLSLLLDHALLIHREQRACLENGTPAYTVGSLKRAAHADAFLELVRKIIATSNPAEIIEELAAKLKKLFLPRKSKKHMSGYDLGRLEPTPSLRYRAAPST